jgi:hypothetical protein
MPRTTLAFSEIGRQLNTRRAWTINTNTLIQNAAEIKTLYSHQRSRDTTNTPNYRSIKAANKEDLPMQPFQYVENRDLRVNGVYEYWDPQNNVYGIQTGPLYTLSMPSFTSHFNADLRNQVNANALNNSLLTLKGMKVNLGNALGQMKQTVGMILGTAQRIGNSLRALRKGNFRNAAIALGVNPGSRRNGQSLGKDQTKGLSDAWLALQFGWKPLVADVYDACDDLARLNNDPRRVRVSCSRTRRWAQSLASGDWEGVPVHVHEEGWYTRKYVYIFSYRRETFANLSRFGLTNPVAVAWELLPWSFVVDWFIPVGDFIDTLDATFGFEFQKGCVTTFWKNTQTATSNAAKLVNGHTFSTMKAQAIQEVVFCQRGVLSGFPSPVIPHLGTFSLSPTRGATIGALLRQRLKL